MREQCDLAETVWGEIEDRQEMLRLLVVLCRAQGVKGLESHEPPSVTLAAWLADGGQPAQVDPELRRLEVEAFIAEAGGEG